VPEATADRARSSRPGTKGRCGERPLPLHSRAAGGTDAVGVLSQRPRCCPLGRRGRGHLLPRIPSRYPRLGDHSRCLGGRDTRGPAHPNPTSSRQRRSRRLAQPHPLAAAPAPGSTVPGHRPAVGGQAARHQSRCRDRRPARRQHGSGLHTPRRRRQRPLVPRLLAPLRRPLALPGPSGPVLAVHRGALRLQARAQRFGPDLT